MPPVSKCAERAAQPSGVRPSNASTNRCRTATAAAAKPEAALAEPRAVVSAPLTVREFMRLSLGASELRLPAEQLIAEAIEEYLDARGVDSLGGEEFLKKLAAASGAGSP